MLGQRALPPESFVLTTASNITVTTHKRFTEAEAKVLALKFCVELHDSWREEVELNNSLSSRHSNEMVG